MAGLGPAARRVDGGGRSSPPGGASRASPATPTEPPRYPGRRLSRRARVGRALAFNPDDGLLYVALSTADALAIVEPGATPRERRHACACASFQDAVAALPGGGALVACRFEPGLRRVTRDAGGRLGASPALDAGAVSGARGLAISPDGRLAYVASPATEGVKDVTLPGDGVVQAMSRRVCRPEPCASCPRARCRASAARCSS